jgi:WD repeat-containing protein 48
MYADELPAEEVAEFRDDQRINLGKWILRYLFTKLIDEEIKRDEAYRQKLNEGIETRVGSSSARVDPPTSIPIPPPKLEPWDTNDSIITPKANGAQLAPTTPGLGIGIASPGPLPPLPEGAATPGSPSEKRQSGLAGKSGDKEDYFANAIGMLDSMPGIKTAPIDSPHDTGKATGDNGKGKDKDKENAKSPNSPAVKKSRWGFGSKKLGRSTSSSQPEKPVVVEEKAEESEASSNHEKEVDDSFYGVLQKIRNEYEKQVAEEPSKMVETKITPSLPNDTPTLKLPSATKVILQEETSGGSAELYRGTVETVGADADLIEQKAPMWLGDLLLTNTMPPKDPVKVSFILHPWQDTLPPLAVTDGNNRLNANRMLRVKKILAYVAERIDPPDDPENPDPDALKPEEYLELYCNEQVSLPGFQKLGTVADDLVSCTSATAYYHDLGHSPRPHLEGW